MFGHSICFCIPIIVEECPEENTDYHVKHAKFPVNTANVTTTWQLCGAKCANEPSCTHWTWLKLAHPNKYFRGKCLFKPKRGNVTTDEWATSGSKECLGTPGRNYTQNN